MAQPSGYPNNIPPMSGSSPIPNGQPPQWGKPTFPMTKPPRQPPPSQYQNSPYSGSSNGTPTHQGSRNPGSLSSHSSRDPSRDPSPVPSGYAESLTRLRENPETFNSNMLSRHSPQHLNQAMPTGSPHSTYERHSNQPGHLVSRVNQPAGESASEKSASLRQQYMQPQSYLHGVHQGGDKLSSDLQNTDIQSGSMRTLSPSKQFNTNQMKSTSQSAYSPMQQMSNTSQCMTNSASGTSHNNSMPQRSPFTTVSSSSNTFQIHSQPIVASQPVSGLHEQSNVNSASTRHSAMSPAILDSGLSSRNEHDEGQEAEVLNQIIGSEGNSLMQGSGQPGIGSSMPSLTSQQGQSYSTQSFPSKTPVSQYSGPGSSVPVSNMSMTMGNQVKSPGMPPPLPHPAGNRTATMLSNQPFGPPQVTSVNQYSNMLPARTSTTTQFHQNSPPLPPQAVPISGASAQQQYPPQTVAATGVPQPQPRPHPQHSVPTSGAQQQQYSQHSGPPSGASLQQQYPQHTVPPSGTSLQQQYPQHAVPTSGASLQQQYPQHAVLPSGAPSQQQYPLTSGAPLQQPLPPPPRPSMPGSFPGAPPPAQPGRYPDPSGSVAKNQYAQSPPASQPLQSGYPPSQAAAPPYQPTSGPGPQYPMGASAPSYPQPVAPQYQTGPAQQEGSHMQKRYPQQPYPTSQHMDGLNSQMANMSVAQQGFNKLWGLEYYDLLQTRNILPPEKVEPPQVKLHQEFLDNVNCSPEIFRCTLTKIPESNSLLQKSRLPLGILIHPFKDLNHLPVIQCSTIVRCRVCRTYIHPFVYFVDNKRWKCNLCFRVNELPDEFQYDPVSKTYGDPTRRPEVRSSTIEFIAPSEYMLRPPQPAVYLFLLDVSQLAVECGYLQIFCDILLDELDSLPGDGRTQIGFITYDASVHFYNLAEGLSQPQQMVVVDTEDVFLPCPDNLLVNLAESRELVKDLIQQLPLKFQSSYDNRSALGPALQAAYKLMAPTGGRITVFQSCLPTMGPGALTSREDPSQRSGKDAPHLNPATDFYKRLALDCSGQQVAVDLFLINSQYCDVATISGVSRFSGGCVYHFPLFKASNFIHAESFERALRRYLTRKIGFEAVMRIRCSRGLAIHTFHGNFFVRSTDLLSLPNVNPDAGFGMQVSVEESLSELQNVCFQAALLYTTSKGERRIRVHTLCLPVATTLPDILQSADQQCIIGLLAKMAVDRSHQSSLSDARDAFINVAIDVLAAYRAVQQTGPSSGLLAPHNLRLLPLYILALLKYVAFRTGQSTRLDDRIFAMCQMKTLPLASLVQAIYPDLYPVHLLDDQLVTLEDGSKVPQPPRLHLSAEKLEQRGAFLLDTGDHMILYVGHNVASDFCTDVLGLSSFAHIPDDMYELPELETVKSTNIRSFITHLQAERPYSATLEIIRDDSPRRSKFTERLIEDRTESALSYYEFLQHLKANVK